MPRVPGRSPRASARRVAGRALAAFLLAARAALADGTEDLERIAKAEAAGDRRALQLACRDAGRGLALRHQHAAAVPHLTRALELARELDEPALVLESALDLSSVWAPLSEFRAAGGALDEAQRIWASLPEKDPRLGARLLNERAAILVYQRSFPESLALREEALGLARRGGDSAQIARILTGLGQTLVELHRYAEALDAYREARGHEVPAAQRAILLTSIGICHFELNDLSAAADVFEEARRLARSEGITRLVAWATGELGLVRRGEGRIPEAVALYDEAIALFLKVGDVRNAAAWVSNHGVLLRDEGRFQECLERNAEARRLLDSKPGQRAPAALVKNEGQCLFGLGRTREAEDAYRAALEVARAAGDTKILWQASRELARLTRKEGRLAEAEAAYLQSLDAIETLRGTLRLPSFKTDFFEDKVKVYEEAAAFLLEERPSADGPRRAFEVAERSRARSFLDTLAEARAEVHETLPAAVLERERRILAELSELQGRARREGETPEAREAVRARERDLAELALRVRAEHPRFDEVRRPRPVSIREAQSVLEPGETLVAYLLGDEASYAWALGRSEMAWSRLPPRSELETLVLDAFAGLTRPGRPLTGLRSLAERLLPVELRRVALRPAAGGRANTLVLVPSGILDYFPFDVLPMAGGRALAELASTLHVPSATALVELRKRHSRTRSPRLLAVADPVYSDPRSTSSRGLGLASVSALGPLPHTRGEALSVRERFGRSATTLLLGADATESRLKAERLDSFSVLHLAAHGFIDASAPSRSGIVLGVEPRPPRGAGGGAPAPNTVGREDGILQVREIFHLRLSADLVTLSACQSALGRLATGEGMVGLTRAFLYAGADSIVASLWNVSDAATERLMSSFYTRLGEGASQAEALRQARLDVRADPRFDHPYFWAPYLLVGRGGERVAFPSPLPAASRVLWASVLGAGLASALRVLLRRNRKATARPEARP